MTFFYFFIFYFLFFFIYFFLFLFFLIYFKPFIYTVGWGWGRDGHSEQTRFVVERPFRLLKAEKNESKQYI